MDTAPGLQEILVTATRREESLSRVPISVSAYTQETLPSTTFVQFRTGTTFGPWESLFFVDNLLNSHTTTNYERSAIDSGNPVYPPPGPQHNNYTFRPRTFGITVTFHQ